MTATPYRKDKLERILFHQCGPIRHEIKSADGGKLSKKVVFKETGFRLPVDAGPKPAYHVIAHHLTTDPKRGSIIADDICSALKGGRFLLVISDRKDHLEYLAKLVEERGSICLSWMRWCLLCLYRLRDEWFNTQEDYTAWPKEKLAWWFTITSILPVP